MPAGDRRLNMKPWLGITWGISNRYGWGVYGLNLARELLKAGKTFPVCLGDIAIDTLPAETQELFEPIVRFRRENLQHLMRKNQVARMNDAVVLHALGNNAEWTLLSQSIEGEKNVGVIFFEESEISPAGLARLSRLNGVVAGSTWNGEVLKAYGVNNVATVFQGVDTSIFRPQPANGTYDGKFAVFSGGKLDFRKGQDIVVAAFRIFAKRHKDAVLVTAWQNLWPLTAVQIKHSPHLTELPIVRADDSFDIVRYGTDNGIPGDQIVDLGLVPNERMPDILKEMHLAVFPNRCEGGTNLVAMETMACGVPCVIANNTGQRDLIDKGTCYVLEDQGTVDFEGMPTEGWGESSVEELVAAMENAYENHAERRKIGQRGADFMRSWTWPGQIAKLLDEVEIMISDVETSE